MVQWRSPPYVVRHADCDGPTGSHRVYHCSTACYWRQLRARRREERTRTVICEACGGKFQTPRRDARYCCAACRQDAYRRRKELHARLPGRSPVQGGAQDGAGVSIEEAVMD